MKSKVLVVDDHPCVTEGLARVLGRTEDLAVCGGTRSAGQAIAAVNGLKPDVVLVDVALRDGPDGIELTKILRKRLPALPVLVFSMHSEGFYCERALRAGAKGYLTKDTASGALIRAIRAVLKGGTCVSPAFRSAAVRRLASGSRPAARSGVESLSDRQLEIFRLCGRRRSRREIARQLRISGKTFDIHRARIVRKLGLRNSADLCCAAADWIAREA